MTLRMFAMKKASNIRFLIFLLFIEIAFASSETKNFIYPDMDVSVSNLKATTEFLTTIRPYRHFENLESLNHVAQYIEQRFLEYALETELQPFEVDGKSYVNVIGTIGADKPSRVIIGAHYDVCGNQEGADDNASAIAGLLEIARLTREHVSELNYRFDFVAYSLEEPPFFGTENMGSYVHAKFMHEKNVNVVGMICLEMIGYFTDEEKSQEYPLGIMKLFYPSTGNFIAIVGNFKSGRLVKEVKTHMKTTSIETRTLKAPSWIVGVDFSDHRNYWKFGYRAIMVTDTAFYRNPNYHKMTDTIDTLDFDKMKEVVKGVVWTLINLE